MAATYEPIASTTISGTSTSSVTFSGIAATYTDLVLIIAGSSTPTYATGYIRFNGDSGTNYSDTALGGNGSTAYSNRRTSQNQINGFQPDGGGNVFRHHIMSYANTNVYKTVLSEQSSPGDRVARRVDLWRDTSAITSVYVAVSSNFADATVISLYGIKAA